LDRTFLAASLDRFGIKNILFMTLFFIKWSRLVDHSKSGQKSPVFRQKSPVFKCKKMAAIMAAILFSHWKTGPDILASLDRFVMNKIFFMALFFINSLG
jgi:hypothetical protein